MRNASRGLIVLLLWLGQPVRSDEPASIQPIPAEVRLTDPESAEQLLVWGVLSSGRRTDLTAQAQYLAVPDGIVRVSATGLVTPLRDGRADITISHGSNRSVVAVEVNGFSNPPPVSFRRDVIPILSKAGCNSGGCHGKAEGQNGFRLSIFGYDHRADHQALVLEGHGRRVFPPAPQRSLLLQKGSAATPHGGGRKLEAGSRWYRRIERWIAEGARFDDTAEVAASLEVEPAQITLEKNGSQQLRVVSVTKEGIRRCVTAECAYLSNNAAIADVDATGRITSTDIPGEAAILVRHQGDVAFCRVTRPQPASEFVRPPERNFVDRLVWDKLESLGIAVSPLADDATFLRRAALDITGTLPTADEARAFLADSTPDKRQRLVADLLERPEYATYWSQRWADLLQVDKDVLTPQGAVAFNRWIRRQFEHNVPYDEFVRSILTAEGSTLAESPAGFFQVQKDPEKLARSISQLFLGVRIECAQCHHHPFERWDQQDYFALAGLFTGIERKPNPLGGLKIRDGASASDLKNPRTGEPVPAAALGAPPLDPANTLARRRQFATWATSPGNEAFTRTIVNRLWAHYFGRGLIEPVDDIRATNPASNERLLEALTQHLVALKYDIKAFTRTLLDSRAYQISSRVERANGADDQNYSRAAWKTLPAEVLLDAVSQVTGIPEEFNGWPAGYRAIEVWDNKLPSDFLEVFGRPARQSVCACERDGEPSIAQALHLMNSTATAAKIASPKGRAARLAVSMPGNDELIDELYLVTLSRFPSEAERTRIRSLFAESKNRREAVEDILWSLMNTKEFVFNH